MSNRMPDGHYPARAVSAEFGTSTAGNDQVGVEFAVEDDAWKGTRLFWYGSFSARAEQRTVESLRHCGCTFPGGNILDLTGLSEHVVSIDVQTKEYPPGSGKYRQRIEWVNALGGGAIAQKMDDAGRASFAQRMRAVVAATAANDPRARGPGLPGAAATPAAADAAAAFLGRTGTGGGGGGGKDDIPY